jgi:hypothetical protein
MKPHKYAFTFQISFCFHSYSTFCLRPCVTKSIKDYWSMQRPSIIIQWTSNPINFDGYLLYFNTSKLSESHLDYEQFIQWWLALIQWFSTVMPSFTIRCWWRQKLGVFWGKVTTIRRILLCTDLINARQSMLCVMLAVLTEKTISHLIL